MPALTKSSVGSFAGNKGDERTRVCPRCSKYLRNNSRISLPVMIDLEFSTHAHSGRNRGYLAVQCVVEVRHPVYWDRGRLARQGGFTRAPQIRITLWPSYVALRARAGGPPAVPVRSLSCYSSVRSVFATVRTFSLTRSNGNPRRRR